MAIYCVIHVLYSTSTSSIYIYPLLLYLSWLFINDYYFLIVNLKFMDISFPLEEEMKTTEMEEKLLL